MHFQRETAAGIIDELLPLIQMHSKEVSPFQDIEMDPDFDLYLSADLAGHLRVYSARVEKSLQGYAVFFIRPHPHYRKSIQAFQSLLFIHPDYRGSAMSFISFCDSELRKENVEVIHQTVTTRKDFSPVLKRLGYELSEAIFVRRLK